jgi:hypothetical protein
MFLLSTPVGAAFIKYNKEPINVCCADKVFIFAGN